MLRATSRGPVDSGDTEIMAPANAARSRGSAQNRRSLRRRKESAPARQMLGLRERKKARLRQQIIETAIKLFRKQGYENTRIDDIVNILEISQPTFFPVLSQQRCSSPRHRQAGLRLHRRAFQVGTVQ